MFSKLAALTLCFYFTAGFCNEIIYIKNYTVFTKINKNGGPEEDRGFVCGVKT